jgi:4-hydroxybenzoate polyprenyltransferase
MLIQSLRPSHWIKNILVATGLLVSHSYNNTQSIIQTLYAFLIFSLAASAVYMFNDFFDQDCDREHPIKKLRPQALGKIPTYSLWPTIIALSLTSVVLSIILLNVAFLITILIYFTLTTAYTLYFKKMAVIDVILLSMFYSLRILAGTFAISVDPSPWLLSFSVFFFTGLALMKRFNELMLHEDQVQFNNRAYTSKDKPLLANLGMIHSIASIVILTFYIHTGHATEMYQSPQFIWLLCPILLFWIMRMWLISSRGHMAEDSLLFAIRDRASLLSAALLVTVLLIARFYS